MMFRRLGWHADDYAGWSEQALTSGFAFCVPSMHADETVMRLCVVNPLTTVDDIAAILDSMAAYQPG
jgi:hypothetical protein